jgi:hypothetical protein
MAEVQGGPARAADADPPTPTRGAQVSTRGARGWWYLLLLLPFLALLYPPLYAHLTPRIWGIPFFYWYQAVWLIVTAAITTFVYRRTR